MKDGTIQNRILRTLKELAEPPAAEPQAKAKERIRIANPPPGYPNVVGMKHALRWVKQKKAEFVGGVLSLSPSMRQTLIRTIRPARFSGGTGYDEISRPMTEVEVRNLPMLRPLSRTGRRR